MANRTRPTRLALKSARQRVASLRAELVAPSTVALGAAAVASVQGSLDAATWELSRLLGVPEALVLSGAVA